MSTARDTVNESLVRSAVAAGCAVYGTEYCLGHAVNAAVYTVTHQCHGQRHGCQSLQTPGMLLASLPLCVCVFYILITTLFQLAVTAVSAPISKCSDAVSSILPRLQRSLHI